MRGRGRVRGLGRSSFFRVGSFFRFGRGGVSRSRLFGRSLGGSGRMGGGGLGVRGEQRGLVGVFAQDFNLAGQDVVHAADDLDLALGRAGGDGRALGQDGLDGRPDVGQRGLDDEGLLVHVGMVVLHRCGHGHDIVHQLRDTAVNFRAGNHGGHRAAVGVAEHHQDRRAQMVHTVFGGADFIGVGHIARDLDHEHVADALVEKNLHRHARVGTGDDRGEGRLSLGRGHQTAGKTGVGVDGLAQGEAGVARFEQLQRLRGRDDMRGVGRSPEQRGSQDQAKNQDKTFDGHAKPLR